jgi:DNA helicase II / ATP-dependent DNA helicase PcrA
MTRRVAYLIEDQGVDPSRILALTFSRAAARELRERLEDLLGDEAGDRPSVYTLHAFALRQLLRLGGAPSLPQPIRIADDYDERRVVQEEIKVLSEMDRIKDVQNEFNNLASDWETLEADSDEWERRHPNPRFIGAWQHHRNIYGYTLRAELVYALKRYLDEDPDLQLEPEFDHILVDEYQDLNRCELAVVARLVGADRTLFAAGDDDQSIYGFRNAFPHGLRQFQETYPSTDEGELVECFRCDKDILANALNVAEQDTDRIPKDIASLDDADDGQVEAFTFGSIAAEARGVARLCRQLVDDAGLQPGDILILLRNNPHGTYSDPIIEALEKEGMDAELPTDPFVVLDEGSARQIVCVLRLLRDREDGLAWSELLELRDNGIGAGARMAVYRLADEIGERFYQALKQVGEDAEVLEHARRRNVSEDVQAIQHMLDGLEHALDAPASEGLVAVLDAVQLPSAEDQDEIEELLLSLLADDEESQTLGDVEEALHSSRGALDETEREADSDRVQIMSMHAAKGLTAEAVIIASCDDQLIPGDTDSKREMDDQRRLLYVSLTRARHFLFVTYARLRRGRQSHGLGVSERRTYTRFLRDYLSPRSP